MQRRVLMDRASHRGQMMGDSRMIAPMHMGRPMMMPPMGMNPMMMSQQGPMMDGKNPYGSKGGYVDSNYHNNHQDMNDYNRSGRDYGMDSRDYNSEYRGGQDYRGGSDYRGGDYHMGNQYNGQHPGAMQFYGYGVGMPQHQGMMGQGDYGNRTYNQAYSRHNADFNDMNYNDYRGDYADYADYNDYAMEEKDYHKKLNEWTNKLKSKDRFGVPKEQVMKQAENMGVKFNNFTPEEFYAVYLMHISDYPKKANDYNYYIDMAKDWLEDDDVKNKGGDKLCAYLYYVVLGEKK